MSEWQPIETAPRDGTEFFVWTDYQERAKFENGRLCVYGDGIFNSLDFDCKEYQTYVKWWVPEMPVPEDL